MPKEKNKKKKEGEEKGGRQIEVKKIGEQTRKEKVRTNQATQHAHVYVCACALHGRSVLLYENALYAQWQRVGIIT